MSSTKNREGAFTLIELLVVIAIIAILAAILFPVFAQAKFAAKKTVDLSNASQIGLSIMLYINDYDDTMPIFYAYNSDPTIYSPAVHHGTEVLLLTYMKNKQIFGSPLDTGGPYLANEVGQAKNAPTYYAAYGTSYRFDHCNFSVAANESSQDNSFQIYDPFSQTYDDTRPVVETAMAYPAESRVIRLEMFGFFGSGCAPWGYACPPPGNYFQNWDPTGGTMIFADGHAKHIANAIDFSNARVDPAGDRSGDPSSDPNAWSGSWYSLCD
jgi:prepilin-type N-terminal cleavage/methylation domain-containing protein